MNTFFWVLVIVGSLFLISNLGKVKASKRQTDRDNRINRFGKNNPDNIIEGESEEVTNEDK
jgi:hypothetical protein|tara:strand:+ start:65 stop:247 length:183 start_codon:yes stop_codon:yes gene_type:complete